MIPKMRTETRYEWKFPPGILSLGRDDVHVWRVPLELSPSRLSDLHDILSVDEQMKAARFRFQRDRHRFIAARGLLRTVLGRYLEVPPERVRFRYTGHGKPFLVPELGGDRLRFNVSHSNGMALYALTLNRKIGVDLEYIRPDFASMQVAEKFFSPREFAVLRKFSAHARIEGFFNCWTRKEAYVKAKGQGLSLPLDQFDVSLVPGEQARLLGTPGDPMEATRWSLRALSPGKGYVAALAVEGHSWRLQRWQLPARL